MPLTLQQPVYTNPSGDGETIKTVIGPYTEWVSLGRARQILSGKVATPDMILFQALLILKQNNFDFQGGTLAQAAAILNANPIWWV
jgi:hypothetical protein